MTYYKINILVTQIISTNYLEKMYCSVSEASYFLNYESPASLYRLIKAGLLDDPRTMLPNVNDLMVEVLSPYAKAGGGAGGEAKAEEPTAPTGGEEAK